jgi:biotin carboxylase
MPRLLLLLPTTTYRAEAFLDAARTLDLDVTVGSESQSEVRASAEFLPLSFRDLETARRRVLEFARTYPVAAVVGVDDQTALAAAALSQTLALPHNSIASVAAARNKQRMRELLRARAVPVPPHTVFPIDEDPARAAAHVQFPCVLKPLTLSASCGVIRANDQVEFASAFGRIVALLRQLGLPDREEAGASILAEDFLPGREVALEGLLTRGALSVLALFDKPDPLNGPYFEETIYVTPSRLAPATQADITARAAQAAEALGLREGPLHGEFRINDRGVWVLEVAARSIGGRCSRTLHFAAGMSLEELILRHALGMEVGAIERKPGAAGVMMLPIPRAGMLLEVHGEAEALAIPGIAEVEITAQPGECLVPLPEGTRYLGFIIARGRLPEEVEAALREAHRRLEFVIADAPAQALRSVTMRF